MKGQGQPWEEQQANRLAELGSHLEQTRQLQGLSLEQISSQTHIPVRHLKSIEQGNLADLPEGVYIQSFIRHYGNRLGLDGAALATQFPASPDFSFGTVSWHKYRLGQLRPIHLYGLYVLVVIGAVSGLSYLMSRSNSAQLTEQSLNASQPITTPSASTPMSNPTTTSANRPAPSASPRSPQKAVKISLNLVGQSWIRVTTDGKTQFEGVLPQGTQRTWVADKKIVLRAGNAGGVLVSQNQSKAKPMGAPGAVEEATYGADRQTRDRTSGSAGENMATTTSNP